MACERLVAVDPDPPGKEELREAIVEANGNIAARSVAEPQLLGMGTTLTSALIHDRHGDSGPRWGFPSLPAARGKCSAS